MALLTQYEAYRRLLSTNGNEFNGVSDPNIDNSKSVDKDKIANITATSSTNLKPDKSPVDKVVSDANLIDPATLSESVKVLQATGLDLGLVSGILGTVNAGSSLVSRLKDSVVEYKNMSPSAAAQNIMRHLNGLTGGASNRLMDSLDLNKLFQSILAEGLLPAIPYNKISPDGRDTKGVYSPSDRITDQVITLNRPNTNPGLVKSEIEKFNKLWDYQKLRSNVISLPTDYFWVATLKPPFRLNMVDSDSNQPGKDNSGELLGLLTTEINYSKSKLTTKSLELAYGISVDYPSQQLQEYQITIQLQDRGDNLVKTVMNRYADKYKDPYKVGVPLPWEWYFDLEVMMYAPSTTTGVLSPWHTFHLYIVPSEWSEIYKMDSSPSGDGSVTLQMSVIGYESNKTKSWQ